MKSNRILGLQKYTDYPGLAFRMIILFGMYIVLQSSVGVNPYPTTPLKCAAIPQFAAEDAQAKRLTPELSKACTGTSGSLQALTVVGSSKTGRLWQKAGGVLSLGRAEDLRVQSQSGVQGLLGMLRARGTWCVLSWQQHT